MLFEFLNVTKTAQMLINSSIPFSNKYTDLDDAVGYLKQQSVSLYEQQYAGVDIAELVADGVLQVLIWKNVGATYCAVRSPNPPRGEEWPIGFSTPGAVYVEVNLWISLSID